MASLKTLMVSAEESAEFRGHDLGEFERVETAGRIIYRAACRDCGAEVDVEQTPPANGIEIGGAAVALTCTVTTRITPDRDLDDEPEDDGQPSEYEEWQDLFGGDVEEYGTFGDYDD